VLLALVLWLTVVNGLDEDPIVSFVAPLMALGYLTVGALIASRHSKSPIGWLFMTSALGLVAAGSADNYVGVAATRTGWPGALWMAWANFYLFIAAFAAIPFILLLFPDGRLPSRRWRPVAWAMAVAPLIGGIGYAITPGLVGGDSGKFPNPTGIEGFKAVGSVLLTVSAFGSILAALACVVALVLRFRRARGEERQQLRWLAYAAGLSGLFLLAMMVSGLTAAAAGGEDSVATATAFVLFSLSVGVGIPVASGMAILRYRLYDLDIVVKKTVVFGLLAAGITAIYVLVAIGIPTLVLGTGGEGAFNVIQIAAVALIALLINPLRSRARRLADRLVYGSRATPYEVLSEFSERMGGTYSTDDVLPRMAQLISAGTGARRSEVWLRVGTELRLEAAWPSHDQPESKAMAGNDLPSFDGDRAFPVTHQGELLGAVAVSMPASDPLTPDQEKLLRDLASQAGLVLRNVGLTADLRARLEDLQASRQRLVAAQDEERRRLERNIHDGAQQQLVAIGVKLGLARTLMERDPKKANELLEQLQGENLEALEDLRDLARGVYPPLLADQGLASAIAAQARKSTLPIAVDADGIGRYPQDIEAAVYFVMLEALQNVAKYAEATQVAVRLLGADGMLSFEVRDDGVGFDPVNTPKGSGLTNMSDRLAALGGELSVRSSPGGGTTIHGRVPAALAEQPEDAQPAAAALHDSDSRSGLNDDLGM
jgi:signal transduction histidine kinase